MNYADQIRVEPSAYKMRSLIADGIEENKAIADDAVNIANSKGDQAIVTANNANNRVDNIVANNGSAESTEVIDSRHDNVNDITYEALGKRLDRFSSQMADIMSLRIMVPIPTNLDDTNNIKNAISIAENLFDKQNDVDGKKVILEFRGYYKVTSTLQYDPTKITLCGINGATIEFVESENYTNNIALYAKGTVTNAYRTAPANIAITNLLLYSQSVLLNCLVIENCPLQSVYNLKIFGFNTQFQNNISGWGWNFYSSGFENFMIAIKINNAIDTYEKFNLFGCIIQNGQCPFEIDNPNGELYMFGGSIDYTDKKSILNSGKLELFGVHQEFSNLSEELFNLTNNSHLTIIGGMLVSTGQNNDNNFGIINNNNSKDYSVSIDNLLVETGAAFFGKLHLIDGNSNISIRNIKFSGDIGTLDLFSDASTLISEGIGESTLGDVDLSANNRTSPITTQDSGIIELSSLDSLDGTNSIRLNKGILGAGGNFIAYFYIPINNKHFVRWSLAIKANGNFNVPISAQLVKIIPSTTNTRKYEKIESIDLNNGINMVVDNTWKRYDTTFKSIPKNFTHLQIQINLFAVSAETDVFVDSLKVYGLE